MRRLYLALSLAVLPTVAACAPMLGALGVPASPAAVADRTVLDEQVGAGVELAYKAWRVALETAVDAKLLRGAAATRAAELDNAAFAAVEKVRAAYRTGNATSYAAAAGEARAVIANALATFRRN